MTLRLISALVLTAVCGAATIAEAQQRITATALVQTYDQNEIRAETLYEGKTFEIEGRVGDIGTGILGAPYVTLEASGFLFRSVQCFFPRRRKQDLAVLNPGQRVVLRGRIDGLMMNVLVEDCSIVERLR